MSAARLESIRSLLSERGDDALVLTAREDIRWACGFSGSNGILVVTQNDATLFTDGRYTVQAASEVNGAVFEIHTGDLFAAVAGHDLLTSVSSVIIDGAHTTVADFRRMQAWPNEPKIRSCEAILTPLTVVKDDEEIRRMRRAQEISDVVLEEILELIRPGITERELAAEIVYRHMKRGADAMSFDPIVASGANGALPHARPTDRPIYRNDLIVLDFGCFVDGYASDMTRTIGLGTPASDALEAYSVVHDAQQAAQNTARSGIRACDLDRVARDVITAAGLGDAFSHSSGHGLGLRIHEPPRLASTNDEILPEYAVVTIEPGVYIQGRFGVRIENAVILRQTGCEPLPKSSTDLILL